MSNRQSYLNDEDDDMMMKVAVIVKKLMHVVTYTSNDDPQYDLRTSVANHRDICGKLLPDVVRK